MDFDEMEDEKFEGPRMDEGFIALDDDLVLQRCEWGLTFQEEGIPQKRWFGLMTC